MVTFLRSRVNLRNRLEQRGAGFLALLITTALMAAAAAAGVQWTSHVIQREREKQLLWAGAQIQRALMAYAQTAPDEATRYPLETGPTAARHKKLGIAAAPSQTSIPTR